MKYFLLGAILTSCWIILFQLSEIHTKLEIIDKKIMSVTENIKGNLNDI